LVLWYYRSVCSPCQVRKSPWEQVQMLTAVPESPRYLVWTDRHDEAWKVLRKLHMNPEDHSDAEARAEFDQISRQVAYDKTQDSSYKHMFVKPSLRKRTIMVILLGSVVVQQAPRLYADGALADSPHNPQVYVLTITVS
jgi:hypothetical protein